MTARPFKQVDVFTHQAYYGNPLAVVLDGSGLDDEAMQRFARWTNLSETTFLLPPSDADADYRVRIFTPGGELPFAGHPTLGSCHAWLQAGGQPQRQGEIVQQCAKGLVRIRREPGSGRLAFAAPPLQRTAPSPDMLARVAASLGLRPAQILAAQVLDNGPVWFSLLLDSPDTVLQLRPHSADFLALKAHVGVAALYPHSPHSSDSLHASPPLIARRNREALAFGARPAEAAISAPAPDLEVRALIASASVYEDPVTGSLNASLAQWLIAEGHAPARYTASQGMCLGRAGQIYIERDAGGQVWVGGDTVTCVDGHVVL